MAHDDKWLIRSGGRIIGPFKESQIPELLKSREIQLRDEISSPLARWLPMERHPLFIEVTESFKREILTEKTEFNFTPTASGLTQTTTDLVDSELTEEISSDLSGFTTTKEIVVNDVEEVSKTIPRNLESAHYQLKGLDTAYVKGKSKKASLMIQAGALLCALLVAGFLFLRSQSQKPEAQKLSSSQVKSLVLKMIERGDYDEALNLMRPKQNEADFVSQLGIYYALLSLQQEEQSLLARRILQQVQQTQPDMEVRTQTGIGLSNLVDKNYSQAAENFKAARVMEPEFAPAKVDEIVTRYLLGHGKDFEKLLSDSFVKNEPEALLTVCLFLVKTNRTDLFNQVLKTLEVYSQSSYYYQLEARLLEEYIKWRLDPQNPALSEWESLADFDPYQTENHRQNVFVYRRHLNWSSLLPLCVQMTKSKVDRVEGQILSVLCHLKAERFSEARAQAERLVDRSPKYGLGQAWYALALRESGSPEQSSVALGRAIEADRTQSYKLPILLQARFCESSKNLKCAHESWKRLLELDYNNLAALAGLAKTNREQNAVAEANRFLKRGISLSADYKPFLAFKEEWGVQL